MYTFASAFLKMVRPIFGPHGVCIYPISCSEYISRLFKEYSLSKASFYALKQLVSCNPLVGIYLWHKNKR